MKPHWRIIWDEIYYDKLALFCFILFAGIVLASYIWSAQFSPDDIRRIHLMRRNLPPSQYFPLGTDTVGRDMIIQLVVGARNSFTIAFIVTFISSAIGIFIGLIAGFFGGNIDNAIMRFIDFLIIVPTFMVSIVFITLLPSSPFMLGLILTVFGWLGPARAIRMMALRQGSMDYVKASKTLGTPTITIIFRGILPNIVSFIVVSLTLSIANNIGIETGLTFLGFGMPFTTPSLGTLIAQAADFSTMRNRPWQWLPAALLILVVTLCVNYIGQAVSRASDVRRRK